MKRVQISKGGKLATFSTGNKYERDIDCTKMEVDLLIETEKDERTIKLLKWAKSHMVY
jgi:hypothetical protein